MPDGSDGQARTVGLLAEAKHVGGRLGLCAAERELPDLCRDFKRESQASSLVHLRLPFPCGCQPICEWLAGGL